MASTPDFDGTQDGVRVQRGYQGLSRKQALDVEIKDFIIGAYLTSRHNVLTASHEIMVVAWRPTTRLVHELVRVAFADRTISYRTVCETIAEGRRRQPNVFVFGEWVEMQRKVGDEQLPRPARLLLHPGSDLPRDYAAQQAVVKAARSELIRMQTHFQEVIRQQNKGTLVLNLATFSWEWRA